MRVRYTTRGGTHGGQLTVQDEGVWELYLVNSSHRNKINVGKSEIKSELEQKAAQVEALCGIKLEAYSPVVSESSRRKRR